MGPSGYTQYQAINKTPTGKMNTKKRSTTGDFTYEHFPVVCPTCEGTGEICEDDGGMVTFVPVKDKRLKPAWTKTKVIMTLLIFLIVGGASTYFLYPRSVHIYVSAHSILDYRFQEHKRPWIQYSFDVSVDNNNFFGITINKISMDLLYRLHSVAKENNAATLQVGMRTSKMALIKMNVSYDSPSDKFIMAECYRERDFIGQLIQTSGEVSYWIHNEHLKSADDYFYTDCGAFIFPEFTTAKPTTTATTATKSVPTKPASTTHGILTTVTKTTKHPTQITIVHTTPHRTKSTASVQNTTTVYYNS